MLGLVWQSWNRIIPYHYQHNAINISIGPHHVGSLSVTVLHYPPASGHNVYRGTITPSEYHRNHSKVRTRLTSSIAIKSIKLECSKSDYILEH